MPGANHKFEIRIKIEIFETTFTRHISVKSSMQSVMFLQQQCVLILIRSLNMALKVGKVEYLWSQGVQYVFREL